jgi:transposase
LVATAGLIRLGRSATRKRIRNAAERVLRGAVIARKLSYGTQSAGGSRFVERMLSVATTCRQQGRAVFAFLSDALQAAWAGRPALVLVAAP